MVKVLAAFSGFSVRDKTATQQFYTEKLGLTVEDDGMGLQISLPGGAKVFAYQKDDHVPAEFTVLNFVVESIDDSIKELQQNGVNFERYDNLPAEQDELGVLRGLAAGMGP